MNVSYSSFYIFVLVCFLSLTRASANNDIRKKRGAAYAGPHPGGGQGQYGQGGVGIPGLHNAIQYAAYSKLLNSGSAHSSGYGGGHGRKLTVDEAIGRFGHHTLSRSYPYTSGHGAAAPGYYGPTAHHGQGGGGGGHGSGGGSGHGGSGGYGK